ncbi:MAG: hypothetical protein IT303_11920 [Dehalococcoidia bacterium]|nr:hypothetical protein [Dehalococcoidia bacterium]
MAEKHFESDDPLELVAARFPIPEGVDIDEVTARVFIEEYALMGMSREKIYALFRNGYFAGTNAIYDTRGEVFVQRLIDEVFGPAPQEVA